MESTDRIIITNTGASATGASTTLKGGLYAFDAVATFGTGAAVTLLQRGPDGVTWINVPVGSGFNNSASNSATISSNSTSLVVALSPGQYNITTGANTTAAYASVVRIPV